MAHTLRLLTVLGALFVVVGLLARPVLAQIPESFGVAHPYNVDGENIEDGTVISYSDGSYHPSTEPFDKNMFGVVSTNPAIEFIQDSTQSAQQAANAYPIVVAGVVEVKVTAKNGRIQKGDLVTTSDVTGVAMRADKSGFILGIAQEPYGPESLEDVGLIKVSLDPKFVFAADSPGSENIGDRLLEILNFSSLAALQDPATFFRYVIAAIMLLGALAMSFISLVRTAQKGIDAMGRNPLAKFSIALSIFINVLISLAMIAAGVAGAYILLVLQ